MIFSKYPQRVKLSEFLMYLIQTSNSSDDRIPPLSEMSKLLGISTTTLREQLEEAKTLGLVEAKPKSGIKRLPFSFSPAVCKSLTYATTLDRKHFVHFSDLRNHIEEVYWFEAVKLLTREDLQTLKALVDSARSKLRGNPIEIPHKEHRTLHLTIFSHLENPFVFGLLEAYWDMYEAFGMNLYSDISYLENVWSYHEKMVQALETGDFKAGYQALKEHMNLINLRNQTGNSQIFE
jgi:DNA-binding FadR family transcriptional regulator